MKEDILIVLKIAFGFAVAAFLALWLILPAEAQQEVCPEEGKVESVVDGDLDNIVLDAGTLVCIKGGQVLVTVTADGESTLAELLGTGQNVSHYTILEEPCNHCSTTTTTSTVTTSTTTVATTTTAPPTTTTTEREVTTTESPTTTTTPEASSTTEPETESTTTSTSQPITSTSSELPYTGADNGVLALLGAILSLSGLSVLAWVRREI